MWMHSIIYFFINRYLFSLIQHLNVVINANILIILILSTFVFLLHPSNVLNMKIWTITKCCFIWWHNRLLNMYDGKLYSSLEKKIWLKNLKSSAPISSFWCGIFVQKFTFWSDYFCDYHSVNHFFCIVACWKLSALNCLMLIVCMHSAFLDTRCPVNI